MTARSDTDADLNVTQNPSSVAHLLPLVYDELRALAQRLLQRERCGHTLQATALVHEAYLRLLEQRDAPWKSRAYFFGAAARILRRILVNHEEARSAAKRGGNHRRIAIDADLHAREASADSIDLILLDDLLDELGRLDERQARIVELKFFGGLSIKQIAEVLQISPRTVDGEWALARAWLRTQMRAGDRV